MTRERLALALFLEFLAALVLVGVASLAVRFSQPAEQPPPEAMAFAHRVRDRELLTVEQAREAVETGRVAFDCAGVHYVVENIPREYTFKE